MMNSRNLSIIKEFEYIREMAELKALSNYSLENKLTNEQFNRIMKLKNKLLKGGIN